jgi:hypothetical protein
MARLAVLLASLGLACASPGDGAARSIPEDLRQPVAAAERRGQAIFRSLASAGAPAPASPRAAELARARELGLRSATHRCSDHPDAVAIHDAEVEEIRVYLLAPPPEPDSVVLAGHDLARVSDDGRRLIEVVPLSRSCVVEPRSEGAESLTVTHVLDLHPIETHVLASLELGIPVYVSTDRGRWKIEGGRISFLGRGDIASPPPRQ